MANSIPNPHDADNASWTKTNLTVTANATTAPDGTTTADKLVETSANGLHFNIAGAIDSSGATRWRLWAIVKPAERTRMGIEADGAFSGWAAVFDLPSAASGVIEAAAWGDGSTNIIAGAQALADGWVYCYVSADNVASSYAPYIFLDAGSGLAARNITYAGDTSKGLYVWDMGLAPEATADTYPGILTLNVTGSQTLSRPTQTSAITTSTAVAVTGAQTLSRPTQSSATAVIDAVTGAQTLSRPTQTSTTAVRDTVTGAQTLSRPTQTSTTAVIDAVTGAQTLSGPTQTSSITTTGGVAVTGAQTLAQVTQTSTVAVPDAVTGTQTTSAPTQTSAVAAIDAVIGSQTLSRPTQSSAVAAVDAVTGAQTTSAPTQTSAIVVVPSGRAVTGAQTLSLPSQSGSIGVSVAVTGAQTLARPTHTSALTSAQLARNITGSQLLLPLTQTFMVRSRIWQSTARPSGIWTDIPDPGPRIWTDL